MGKKISVEFEIPVVPSTISIIALCFMIFYILSISILDLPFDLPFWSFGAFTFVYIISVLFVFQDDLGTGILILLISALPLWVILGVLRFYKWWQNSYLFEKGIFALVLVFFVIMIFLAFHENKPYNKQF